MLALNIKSCLRFVAYPLVVSSPTMKYLALLLSLLIVSSASAESQLSRSQECQNAIKECYLAPSSERSQCLNDAVKITECDGEKVGSLIEDRLSLTGVGSSFDNNSEGIDTVDHTCIKNFDAMLSTELMKGVINPELQSRLKEQLASCSQKASINLFRP